MTNQPWWQTTIVFQVYPRGFQDTTGNGVGDLAGVGPGQLRLAATLLLTLRGTPTLCSTSAA